MRIALFCATARGLSFLKELRRLAPTADLAVFSFREESWEPPFLDSIRSVAEESGASFREVRNVSIEVIHQTFDGGDFDVLIAVSWRYRIPKNLYSRAASGAYVFHDSLLPRYRGFSPTVWSMINGESVTGVSILRMEEGIDEGDIIDQQSVPIHATDAISDVLARVTDLYLSLLRRNWPGLSSGSSAGTPQDHAAATYCCRRFPEDNRIDWTLPSRRILDLIRAVTTPYPGAFTTLEGKKIIVWSCEGLSDQGPRYVGIVPGRVVSSSRAGVAVLTGDGSILLREVESEATGRTEAATVLPRMGLTLGR